MQAKYGICLTKSSYAIDQNKYRSQRVDLNKYTTLILVNGNYSDFFQKSLQK
jgi:hypothetical protein